MQRRYTNKTKQNKLAHSGVISGILIAMFTFASITINLFLFIDTKKSQIPEYQKGGTKISAYSNNNFADILSGVNGRIPILMYHNIITPVVRKKYPKLMSKRNRRFSVTAAEFRTQLQKLHDANFRNISIDEYLSLMKGKNKRLARIPPGCKLYVLTFDDATFGQFDFNGVDKHGEPIIDPDCAVGVMLNFSKKYPEFKLNAAFSIDFSNIPFFDNKYVGKKFNMLLDYGFEIVNHTVNHKALARLILVSKKKVSYEIGHAMELFESYLGYRAATINKICYPGGSENLLLRNTVKNINYNNKNYIFIAGLDAEGLQAKNPNDKNFNSYDISRIELNQNTFDIYVLNAPRLYITPMLQEANFTEQNIDSKMSILSNQITENLQ